MALEKQGSAHPPIPAPAPTHPFTCSNPCMPVHKQTHTHKCAHRYTQQDTHTCTHAHTYTNADKHTQTHTQAITHKHTRRHKHTHIRRQTHMHAQARARAPPLTCPPRSSSSIPVACTPSAVTPRWRSDARRGTTASLDRASLFCLRARVGWGGPGRMVEWPMAQSGPRRRRGGQERCLPPSSTCARADWGRMTI